MTEQLKLNTQDLLDYDLSSPSGLRWIVNCGGVKVEMLLEQNEATVTIEAKSKANCI